MGLYKAYSPAGGTGVGATKLRETRPQNPGASFSGGILLPRAGTRRPQKPGARSAEGFSWPAVPTARLRAQLFRLVRNAPKAEAAKRKGKARTYTHCTPWRMVPATAVSGSL